MEMLVFLKYNLRAIDYNFDLLKPVPRGYLLPNEPHVMQNTSDDHASSVLASDSDSDTDSPSDSDDLESLYLNSEDDDEVEA